MSTVDGLTFHVNNGFFGVDPSYERDVMEVTGSYELFRLACKEHLLTTHSSVLPCRSDRHNRVSDAENLRTEGSSDVFKKAVRDSVL